MIIKKTKAADFHLGNKLGGQKATATYKVFSDGVEVGHVVKGVNWDAYYTGTSNRINNFSCSSLKALKSHLEAK